MKEMTEKKRKPNLTEIRSLGEECALSNTSKKPLEVTDDMLRRICSTAWRNERRRVEASPTKKLKRTSHKALRRRKVSPPDQVPLCLQKQQSLRQRNRSGWSWQVTLWREDERRWNHFAGHCWTGGESRSLKHLSGRPLWRKESRAKMCT